VATPDGAEIQQAKSEDETTRHANEINPSKHHFEKGNQMNSNQQVQSVAKPGTKADHATIPGANCFGEQAHPRILRLREVIGVVGLKKSAIYEKIAEGSFPPPIKVGGHRASGWLSTEVYAWCAEQIQRSRST
jgi:prophage regulatory protein